MGLTSRGRIARYCAGLESPWDFSLASSNLALGAKICIINSIHRVRRMGFLFNATSLRISWRCGVTVSSEAEGVALMERLSDHHKKYLLEFQQSFANSR